MDADKHALSNLVVDKQHAEQKVRAQIDKGQQLVNRPILSEYDLEEANSEFDNWSSYNEELLLRLFDNSAMADKYTDFYGGSYSTMATLGDKIGYCRRDVTKRINRLKGILEQLELIPEQSANSTIDLSGQASPVNGNEAFIVHGHDRAVKSEVARFVKDLGLEPVILDEKPGAGRTIIEKFESYANNAAFAIVLLTPDDVGAPKDRHNDLKPRARQNVIFEIGYFFKGLGRGRVCAMSTEDVEFPSDLNGVSYVFLDPNGGWQLKLFQEMKAAGLPVDSSGIL